MVQAMYGTVEGLSTFFYQPKQYCKQFHTHDTCDSPHSERLHKPLFPAAWGNTWEAQNYITYTQNSCYGFVYMCVCICVRVCLCVYRYVCVCVGLCNTQEHPGLPDTLWFYPESRMGISQKCWVLQSKADNCYLTKNLGPFRFKRTFLCTREWWLQYGKCWDPPPGASLITSPTRFGRTMSFESNTTPWLQHAYYHCHWPRSNHFAICFSVSNAFEKCTNSKNSNWGGQAEKNKI